MSNHDEHEFLKHANPGMTPLDDDDLEEVTGGITKGEAATVKIAANAEGRTKMLRKGNLLCGNNHQYKWAETATVQENGKILYTNIKCYKCQRTWPSFEQ